jgi:hypothetical protein
VLFLAIVKKISNCCNSYTVNSYQISNNSAGGLEGGCGVRRGGRSPARHCEAPVSLRYVQCYRCEAIQCRGDNIRTTYIGCLRQPWIASPHINGTYRKCGGGFAKTGRASPCPVPAHCAGTVDEGYVRARRGAKAGLALPSPSLRSTGQLAIRRALQVRSNPVPEG